MIDPCWPACLADSVMAGNPPSGLTSVDADNTDQATELNAMVSALPQAIRGGSDATRNICFGIPSARANYYYVASTVTIDADGTMLINLGSTRPRLLDQFTASRGYADEADEPWWRNTDGVIPFIDMDGRAHCHWHGGGLKGTGAQAGGFSTGHSAFRMGTSRFCVVGNVHYRFGQRLAQITGVGAGEYSEFCEVRDCHLFESLSSNRYAIVCGFDVDRSTSGAARFCGGRSLWAAGGSPSAMRFDDTEDCYYISGYLEYNNGPAGQVNSPSVRAVIYGTNEEGSPDHITVYSGAEIITVGHTNLPDSSASTGAVYEFDWASL